MFDYKNLEIFSFFFNKYFSNKDALVKYYADEKVNLYYLNEQHF